MFNIGIPRRNKKASMKFSENLETNFFNTITRKFIRTNKYQDLTNQRRV